MSMVASPQRIVLLLLVLAAMSCAHSNTAWVDLTPDPSVSAPAFQIVGSVEYVDVEGGVYVIRVADGTRYTPINLPESFKVGKMAVEAIVRRRDDLMSTTMVGPMIELVRIRPRPDA